MCEVGQRAYSCRLARKMVWPVVGAITFNTTIEEVAGQVLQCCVVIVVIVVDAVVCCDEELEMLMRLMNIVHHHRITTV